MGIFVHILSSRRLMLNFNEEIKKFKLSLEVDHIEQDIQDQTIEDLLDILRQTKTQHIKKIKENQLDEE